MNANDGAIKYDLRTFVSANENYHSAWTSLPHASAMVGLRCIGGTALV